MRGSAAKTRTSRSSSTRWKQPASIAANIVEEKESGAQHCLGFGVLTPLFRTHVNPYGRFDLDMRPRITALT